jgi:hypothetical protein
MDNGIVYGLSAAIDGEITVEDRVPDTTTPPAKAGGILPLLRNAFLERIGVASKAQVFPKGV